MSMVTPLLLAACSNLGEPELSPEMKKEIQKKIDGYQDWKDWDDNKFHWITKSEKGYNRLKDALETVDAFRPDTNYTAHVTDDGAITLNEIYYIFDMATGNQDGVITALDHACFYSQVNQEVTRHPSKQLAKYQNAHETFSDIGYKFNLLDGIPMPPADPDAKPLEEWTPEDWHKIDYTFCPQEG